MRQRNREQASMRKRLRMLGIILFWVLAWYAIALLVDNQILLVTPWSALVALVEGIVTPSFWQIVGMSLLRIGAGFLSGMLVAILLAILSFRFGILEELLRPVLTVLKTIPVVSFVVLLLIWWGAAFLSVAISFLVVLPNIYVNVLEGLKSTPVSLLEMAKVFKLPFHNRFFYIYRPALRPFLLSALQISLGMCWKSGVAAEVIGTPVHSIGEQLYLSKIHLNTAGIFAWTAVVILLSILFEKGVLFLVHRWFAWEVACNPCKVTAAAGEVACKGVFKAFGEKQVLDNFSAAYKPGEITYLTWNSGAGKTTLLRLLAGLEKADAGVILSQGQVSFLFQEDRLCEEYSAVKNVELILGDVKRSEKALLQLLNEEDINKPCGQLSGGMKRRVALVRAVEAGGNVLLLDEPFTGMDEETMRRATAYIENNLRGRVVVMATHIR